MKCARKNAFSRHIPSIPSNDSSYTHTSWSFIRKGYDVQD